MTNKLKVQRFTEFGLQEVKHLITTNNPFNKAKLQDTNWTEPCLEKQINLDFKFKLKSELGEYLNTRLSTEVGLDNQDTGMWTWLCFVYIDQLIKVDSQGLPNYLSEEHYVFTKKGHKSSLTYRHFVFSSYMSYMKWGKKAEIFNATNEPEGYGDAREQFLARNYLYEHFNLFYDLFYDPSLKGMKKQGRNYKSFNKATKKFVQNPDGTYRGYGAQRRWIQEVERKARIYRLHGMKRKSLKKLFSPEF